MALRKYKRGKQICTVSDFDQSSSRFYVVYFGSCNPQTKHRSFLISWQYRTLLNFIEKGLVFEAVDESFLNPKGKQSIKQRFRYMYGYDAEHICKNCKYCVYTERDRKYYKCRLIGVSASEATDIRLKDVACGMWERKEE